MQLYPSPMFVILDIEEIKWLEFLF
jgi:hypothetical protein